MKVFDARRICLGRVIGLARFEAESSQAAWRLAHQGIDALSGEWVELTEVSEDSPERGELIREAVETMKHPENLAHD